MGDYIPGGNSGVPNTIVSDRVDWDKAYADHQAYEGVTDAQRVALGITVRDDEPTPVPTRSPGAVVEFAAMLLLLDYSRNPRRAPCPTAVSAKVLHFRASAALAFRNHSFRCTILVMSSEEPPARAPKKTSHWQTAGDYGVDVNQLQYLLSLTPTERILRHDQALDLVHAMRAAGIEYYGFDPRPAQTPR